MKGGDKMNAALGRIGRALQNNAGGGALGRVKRSADQAYFGGR